jgi:hypothetical protein
VLERTLTSLKERVRLIALAMAVSALVFIVISLGVKLGPSVMLAGFLVIYTLKTIGTAFDMVRRDRKVTLLRVLFDPVIDIYRFFLPGPQRRRAGL